MSFKEFNAALDSAGNKNLGLPPIGGHSKTPKNTKAKVRYFLANVEDPGSCAMLEDILTKSMNGGGLFSEIGDVIVLREDSHFTKEGDYVVALKYVELIPKNKATNTLDQHNANAKINEEAKGTFGIVDTVDTVVEKIVDITATDIDTDADMDADIDINTESPLNHTF